MNNSRNSFEDDIQCLLHEKKFELVQQHLKLADVTFVANNVWNLINTVCSTLKNNEHLLQNDIDIENCQKIILYLVSKGKPKEILVALMEEADSFKSHEFFCFLLEPIKETLKKTPGKRGKSLEWILSALNAHIETLSVPNDVDLQGDEKLLLDSDPAVIDASYVLSNYCHFLSSFVEEVSFIAISEKEFYYSDRVKQQQDVLWKHILKLFNHPLLYHDLHVQNPIRPKSSLRIICERYVQLILKICKNIFNLFKYNTDAYNLANDSECCVPLLAFSNLAYLIFCENIALDSQPFVHSHQYMFMFNLKYIISLLCKEENLILFKGLKLAKILLERLEESELKFECLELELFTKFPMILFNIAVNCSIEVHRNDAVKTFLCYISKCDWKVKYHIIMQVISNADNSCVESLVINLFKNYLHIHLTEKISNGYFLGNNLQHFLKSIFVLKDGVETDILQNNDKILSSLNLLRYLIIRDKKETNITGIWDLSNMISNNFLKPLKTGLDLSRAHYEQSAKDFKNNQQIGFKSSNDILHNTSMRSLVPEMEEDVLRKALITFDMIESILSRVNELMMI